MFSVNENNLKSMEKLLLSICLLLTIFGPRELRGAAVRSDAVRGVLSPTFIFKRLSKDLDNMVKRTMTANEDDDDEGTDKRDIDTEAFLHPWTKSQRNTQMIGKRIQFNLMLRSIYTVQFATAICFFNRNWLCCCSHIV